jgi:ABC-type branched-subunit amino acid transport system substrate-binding protein
MQWPRRNQGHRSGWVGELPPWWKRWPGNALCVLGAVVLVAGVLIWAPWRESLACAQGVQRVEGECVGMTDGAYAFEKNLGGVFEKIHEENKRVMDESGKKDGPSQVGIVYLMSMVPGEKDTNTRDSVRHEIEGAYAAQHEANHTSKYGDTPKIRLLLAHIGDTAAQHSAALEQIRQRKDADRLVAVAGLGTSMDDTEALIRRITRPEAEDGLHLAAVGAVLTADTLSRVPGLVRVAPVNSDEAAAAAAFLAQEEHAKKRVLVIQDERPKDQYTRTLGDGFLAALPRGRLAGQTELYDSSQGGVATAFKTRMANICAKKPDVIFFAGRGIDLPRFLAPLKDRPCTEPLLVISGDDASQSAQAKGFDDIKGTLRDGNVRLIYTGLAHPGGWERTPEAYPGWGRLTFGAGGRYRTDFPEEALDDGQAVMGHDAVLTALTGIRLAADASETNNGNVTGSEVIQIWRSLHGVNAVRGASGLISLGNDGSPERKAVPIIEIGADGSVRTLAVSARGGKPLTEKDSGQ